MVLRGVYNNCTYLNKLVASNQNTLGRGTCLRYLLSLGKSSASNTWCVNKELDD